MRTPSSVFIIFVSQLFLCVQSDHMVDCASMYRPQIHKTYRNCTRTIYERLVCRCVPGFTDYMIVPTLIEGCKNYRRKALFTPTRRQTEVQCRQGKRHAALWPFQCEQMVLNLPRQGGEMPV